MDKKRPFNVIIYGADGCMGRYTVEAMANYCKKSGNKPITWAIGGRFEKELKATLDEVSLYTGVDCRSTECFVVDAMDLPALSRMVGKADVLINCTGPYRFLGENIIQACLVQQTHYIGGGGEGQYLMKMQLKYDRAARNLDVYVVESCGMASILADFGTLFLQDNVKGALNGVEIFTDADSRRQARRANYASWVAYIHILANNREWRDLEKKCLAGYPTSWEYPMPNRGIIHFSKLLGSWSTVNLQCDTNVTLRSQKYLCDTDKDREPIQVKSYVRWPSLGFSIFTTVYFLMLMVGANIPPIRWIMQKFPALFSLGLCQPSKRIAREVLAAIWMKFHVFGYGWPTKEKKGAPNKIYKAEVTCMNPAFGATGTMLVESAWTVLFEKEKLPDKGGVFTPGAAFYRTSFLDRLNANDIRFKLIEG